MARERESSAGCGIALLTDFGTGDGYVGAMKGVILGLNPRAPIVDITHEIPRQGVRDAAFVLHTVHRYFPTGTVLLAVVDPGVGSDRAAVVVDTGRAVFVAPDNGLLSFVLAEGRGSEPRTQNPEQTVPIPDGWRAVRIAEPRFWLPNPSSTFHGRDIFAPVAAHLSLGEPLESFGPPMEALKAFPIPGVERPPGGELAGEVLHVDHFGNLITNLRAEDLPHGEMVTEIAGHRLQGVRRTYAGATGLVALVGSSGYLEVALPGARPKRKSAREWGRRCW